jgi:hypothetical protein
MSIKTDSLLFHLLRVTKKTKLSDLKEKDDFENVCQWIEFEKAVEACKCPIPDLRRALGRGILCSRTRWLIVKADICAVSDQVYTVTTPVYYSYSRLGL